MRAFTLVELIVSLAVIGCLLFVGIPIANKAIESGKKTKEVSGLKNLITAYNLYIADNNGILIKSYDINGTGYDIFGNFMQDRHESQRWPWRLAPYFNYNFYGCTLVNDSETYIKKQGGLTQTYLVSVIPSFGLNIFLGGNDYEGKQYQSRIATNINQVSKPSQVITFITSRSMAAGQRFEGFYYVEYPKSKGKYDSKSHPKTTGYISARYSGNVIAAFLDGRVSSLNYQEITDTKNWYPLD